MFIHQSWFSYLPELRMFYHILQLAVDEFFAIPSYLLLQEDSQQITQYTKEDEEQLDKEIKQLEARAKRVCSNTGMLQAGVCVCVCRRNMS